MASEHEDTFEYDPGTVEQLFNSQMLEGTITAIDYWTETATVLLEGPIYAGDFVYLPEGETISFPGVKVFYHCKDRTDTEMGSFAFTVGDKVLVYYNGKWPFTVADGKVVGFVDGLKNCPYVVLLKTTSAVGNAEFITAAQQRIDEIQIMIDHIEYRKDVFTPEVIAMYNGWADPERCLDGYWQYGVFNCTSWFTQEMADAANAPYEYWRDHQYATQLAYWTNKKTNWEDIKLAAQYLEDYARITQYIGAQHVGTYNWGEAVVFYFCCATGEGYKCPIEPIPGLQGVGEPDQAFSDLAEEHWNLLPSACSYIASIDLYIPYLIHFTFKSKGAMDTNNVFYLFGYDFDYTDPQIEELKFQLLVDGGRPIFEWPTDFYLANTWQLDGPDAVVNTALDLRLLGELAETPTEFGAEFFTDETDPLIDPGPPFYGGEFKNVRFSEDLFTYWNYDDQDPDWPWYEFDVALANITAKLVRRTSLL